VVLALQGCFACWALQRGWSSSLIDQHEYRQAQTALSSFWMLRGDISPAYPPLPLFGPPWSAPMEFPLYQYLVAGGAALTGSSLETAGRGISVLMLLLALPAIWRLGSVVGWSRPSRVLAMALALSAPVHLFYGRAILIETTALAGALWFLACFARALEKPSAGRIALAVVLGVVAGLTKATTFLVFLLPAAFLVMRSRPSGRPGAGFLFATVAPPVIALGSVAAWVAWSDIVKRSNPFSAFLDSAAMRSWNWGTVAQRASGSFWAKIWQHTAEGVLAVPALVAVVLLVFVVPSAQRRQALALAGAYLASVLLFSNLFFVHDYYFCANAALLLGAAAVVLAGAWESPALPRGLKVAATVILFGAQAWTYDWTYGHHFRRGSIHPPAIAQVIRENTQPDDIIVYYGAEWGAVIPYYSERRAIMISGAPETDTAALDRVVGSVAPRRIAAMYVGGFGGYLADRPEFVRGRAARLGLAGVPVVESDNERLFLRKDLLEAAQARLARSLPSGLRVNQSPATEEELRLPPQEVPAPALALLAPAPLELRAKFPTNVMDHEGQPVLSVHAPAEFRFHSPAATRRIVIEAGLLPGAYAPGPGDATDGVEVVVFALGPDGSERELFRRWLRPAENPADRGVQRVQVEQAEPFASDIVVAITSGPAGKITKDWAFVRRIEFQ
jgi:hypothetical protein